jgi:glycosyltransferase involved in cell wall biosynthesis
MAKDPLISVIVPMFNSEKTIGHTLKSILNQEGAFEVLVVDDGSTDSSARIVDVFSARDSRIRRLSFKRNQGHGPARNHGIASATGEYLVFVDADDELLPSAIANISAQINSTQPDLLFIGCVEKKRGKYRPLTDQLLLKRITCSKEPWSVASHPEVLVWPAATWSKVYRREFIEKNHIRFPGGFHQDIPWSLLTTLKALSISAVVDDCYLYVRRGAGSSTTNLMSPKTLARIDQVKLVRESVSMDSLPPRVGSYLTAMCAVHLLWGLLAAYRTVPEELRLEHFTKTAAEFTHWNSNGILSHEIRTEPLFGSRERILLSRVLSKGDYALWSKAMRRRQRRLRFARRLDFSRYRLASQ